MSFSTAIPHSRHGRECVCNEGVPRSRPGTKVPNLYLWRYHS